MKTTSPKYGKGSKDRVTDVKRYRKNYDYVFCKKGSNESIRKAAKEFCEVNGDELFKAFTRNESEDALKRADEFGKVLWEKTNEELNG